MTLIQCRVFHYWCLNGPAFATRRFLLRRAYVSVPVRLSRDAVWGAAIALAAIHAHPAFLELIPREQHLAAILGATVVRARFALQAQQCVLQALPRLTAGIPVHFDHFTPAAARRQAPRDPPDGWDGSRTGRAARRSSAPARARRRIRVASARPGSQPQCART